MANKYTFHLTSDDRRRPFPNKIIVGQGVNESVRHVVLKFLGWVLFYRERLRIDTDVQDDSIPFVPDLVEIGYDMRPLLWVECGDCAPSKLHKIAVKCPGAEIWAMKRSPEEAGALLAAMGKAELRRGRYGIVAFDPEMFDEACGLATERSTFHWFRGGLDPAQMQFELNGLWFDSAFTVYRY